MVGDRWFTVEQVAEIIQVHPETVRRWLREGRLKGFALGGKSGWRIRERDIDAFIEDAEGKAAA